jgi:hypothetical protein
MNVPIDHCYEKLPNPADDLNGTLRDKDRTKLSLEENEINDEEIIYSAEIVKINTTLTDLSRQQSSNRSRSQEQCQL